MKDLFYRLIGGYLVLFAAITSPLFFFFACIIWLVSVPFDKRLYVLHQYTCFWASLYFWFFPPWSVSVEGREKIDPAKTYVMVSNHQSLVDILAVFHLFAHFKWVSKIEIFRLPFIGWNMRLNRYVELVRGQTSSVKEMYAACEKHLADGSSVYLFPEGTRSSTSIMREFKEGAFVLAKRSRVPILPIVINGSRNALPKHSLSFHGNTHITITVLDEIPVSEFEHSEAVVIAAKVRKIIGNRVVQPDMVPSALTQS